MRELVIGRPYREIVLEFLEGLFNVGQLHVERPELPRVVPVEIGTQQITSFTTTHRAQLLAIERKVKDLIPEA